MLKKASPSARYGRRLEQQQPRYRRRNDLAALVHKANTLDPTVIPAETAINMLTEGGAKCLGYTDIGKLEAGYKADITLVDREGLHWYPKHDASALWLTVPTVWTSTRSW